MTEIKKLATSETTPATVGSSSAWRRGVSTSANDPNTDSTGAQKSRLPFWPAYSADHVKKIGRLRLRSPATEPEFATRWDGARSSGNTRPGYAPRTADTPA